VKVFRLKNSARCVDWGKVLQEGEKVRGYLQENGRWKIFCLKHEDRKRRNEPPPHHSTTGSPPAGNLKEALELMQAWGFRYVTYAVWDKEKVEMGHWFRQQHELLLVGVKGTFHTPPPSCRFPSVIRSPRTEHSKKPEVVYEMIETMFPKGRYLELFGRSCRKGWAVWGNEMRCETT